MGRWHDTVRVKLGFKKIENIEIEDGGWGAA
jgi:hypothetical protein